VQARLMRRPLAWAAVATVNLSAMTLFLWHQTAFLAVTTAGLLAGRLPGLHTAPSHPIWVAERVAWLPVFAAALAVLWLVFRRAERAPARRPPRRADGAVSPAPRPTDGTPGPAGRAVNRPGVPSIGAQLRGHGVLDQGDQRHLG